PERALGSFLRDTDSGETMRRFALMLAASVLAALSIAFAASGGNAAEKPSLSTALTRTSQLTSLHYGMHIQIRGQGQPLTLHIRGQSDAHTISVHFASPGMTGGELVYGPFLYEQAPNGIAVYGKVRWLRTPLSLLPTNSRELMVLHALRIGPLLQ